MTDFYGKASEKITKLSGEQVERLFVSLKEENAVFDSILESLPTGLIICDTDWHVSKINKSAKRLIPMKYQYSEKRDRIWDIVEEKDISAFIRECRNRKRLNASSEFSLRGSSKTSFLTVSVLPLLFHNAINGTIIVVEDITSKKQQDILSRRMKNLQSLTSLAASVAHEIKNPLGAISIHIQLLQKAVKKSRDGDGMMPAEKFMENYINVINEEIDILNKTVMDFLFAVRPVQADFVLADPDAIIERTVDFFRPEAESRNIGIETRLSEKKCRLLIDEKLFREVLVNLLQNAEGAVSETERNSGKVIITSSIEEKSERYILSVADNGCGMDEETCSRIFEPYYTTKANGTGLGLTTVYKIIKEFSGDVTVSSQKNTGTIFTISIPIPQENTMLLEK